MIEVHAGAGHVRLRWRSCQYISWVSPNGVQHGGIQQDSAPTGWVFHDGGADNNDGCNDGAQSGKWCSQTAGTDTMDGSSYSWMWTVNPNGGVINPPHLQAAWFVLRQDRYLAGLRGHKRDDRYRHHGYGRGRLHGCDGYGQ